jgi:hypothetical protein
MHKMRLLMPLGIVLTCLLIDANAIGKERERTKVASLAGVRTTAERVPSVKEWFVEFDAIQKESRIPAKERAHGAFLMMRALAGVSEPRECEEANVILKAVSDRYKAAAKELVGLTPLVATECLRSGYIEWFRGNAKLCEDCIALRTVDAGQKKYKRLTQEEVDLLMKRKQILDQMKAACEFADLYIRSRSGIAYAKENE